MTSDAMAPAKQSGWRRWRICTIEIHIIRWLMESSLVDIAASLKCPLIFLSDEGQEGGGGEGGKGRGEKSEKGSVRKPR